jgi:hypothetical protein
MNAYTRGMRLFGWTVVLMVPVIVLVGNWISSVMDPERCPVGLVCVHAQ